MKNSGLCCQRVVFNGKWQMYFSYLFVMLPISYINNTGWQIWFHFWNRLTTKWSWIFFAHWIRKKYRKKYLTDRFAVFPRIRRFLRFSAVFAILNRKNQDRVKCFFLINQVLFHDDSAKEYWYCWNWKFNKQCNVLKSYVYFKKLIYETIICYVIVNIVVMYL